MLYLISGLMGASKTLNALKFVKEDKAFKDRQDKVYYHRINNLKSDFFPGWKPINDDELKAWMDYPEGSVFIVDEADHVFPQRDNKTKIPEYIQQLKESRKRGMDFVFITQHPSMVDVFVRRNIGQHNHLERVFGQERSKWFTWAKYADPTDRISRSQAVTKIVGFDKKYYDAYESAVEHTHQNRFPYKLLAIPFVLALAGVSFAGWQFMGWFDEPESQSPVPIQQAQSLPSLDKVYIPEKSQTPGELDYFAQRTPRIPDVPWSAPVYDEVYEVKSFPRPQCYQWTSGDDKDKCKCVTQQATPLDLSHAACVQIVKHGYFQEFVEDVAIVSSESDRAERKRPEAPAGTADRRPSRYTVLGHAPATRMETSEPRSYSTGAVTRKTVAMN